MTAPHYADEWVTLHHGDCLDVLRTLPDASVDSVVTDPPYGLEFMGKEWDAPWKSSGDVIADPADVGGFQDGNGGNAYSRSRVRFGVGPGFQAWCEQWARECLRVLKPGGYLVSAGGSRTYHRMTSGVEDAGFEIRDCITWHFGSGFPKSRNVTADLRSLPACACDVPSKFGAVDATLPARLVGTGVGAEAGSVTLARSAADLATRVRPKVLAAGATHDGLTDVDAGHEGNVGQCSPVVLGSPPVASGAKGEQVSELVGDVEVDPESLRDQVVGDQVVGSAAISAGAIPGDDAGSDVRPPSALVLPFATAPRGVALASHSGPVSDSHARPAAVDAAVGPVAELAATDSTGVDAISLAPSHGSDSTAERAFRCEACGGVAGKIPAGLGTALKPATEFFVVARKPLIGTVAANILAHGTGALNVDGCRIDSSEAWAGNRAPSTAANGFGPGDADGWAGNWTKRSESNPAGRWPANVVLDEHQAAALDEQSGERPGFSTQQDLTARGGTDGTTTYGRGIGALTPGVREGFNDIGGASRFFIAREDDPCPTPEPANGAPSTSPQPSAPADSARSGVATSAPPVTRSPSQAPSTNGTPSESKLSAVNGTPPIPTTDARFSPESQQPRLTPTASPASDAEQSEPIDITTTTTSRSTSDGSVGGATSPTTSRSREAGASVLLDALDSRFIYTAKAGSDERPTYTKQGGGNGRVTGLGGKVRQCNVCETRAIESGAGEPSCGHGDYRWADPTTEKPNTVSHPTVKPLALMRWLVRLVTPPDGTVLEPFAGSGTTAEACLLERFHCIAIEREADYLPLIVQRITRRRDPIAYLADAGHDLGLFADEETA